MPITPANGHDFDEDLMEARIQLFAAVDEGLDTEQVVKDEIAQGRQAVEQRIQAQRERLLAQQQQLEAGIKSNVSELQKDDLFRAAEEKRDQISRELQVFQKVCDDLQKDLENGQAHLKAQQKQNDALQEAIKYYRKVLKSTRHPCSGTLFQLGRDVTTYVANQMKEGTQ